MRQLIELVKLLLAPPSITDTVDPAFRTGYLLALLIALAALCFGIIVVVKY